MGTFAELYREDGACIAKGKLDEFQDRIEKLYQAGGMMEMRTVSLCGKKVQTIHKASMHGYGMKFRYNYFEDACWQEAGYRAEDHSVFSGEIGSLQFHMVVVAAYVLEEMYTEGTSVAMTDGRPVTACAYIEWLNDLFDESYSYDGRDLWRLFQTMHDQKADSYYDMVTDWSDLVRKEQDFKDFLGISAVLNGTDAAINLLTDRGYLERYYHGKSVGWDFMNSCSMAKKAVSDCKKDCGMDAAGQLCLLIEMLKQYLQGDLQGFAAVTAGEKAVLDCLTRLRGSKALSDLPVFVIRAITEIYSVDFWALWTQYEASSEEGGSVGASSQERDTAGAIAERGDTAGATAERVVSVGIPTKRVISSATRSRGRSLTRCTMELFLQSPDDMIPYWHMDGDIVFSGELWGWFGSLREQLDQMLEAEVTVDRPIEWVIDLMEYADSHFDHVYTFTDFFEETMSRLLDRRYLALWKLYEGMLYGLRQQKDGDAGVRTMLRKYMALVANRDLRREVFGF